MKWEYRVDPISFTEIDDCQSALNTMGRDGWEVAAVIPNSAGKENTWPVVLYKRPKDEPIKSN